MDYDKRLTCIANKAFGRALESQVKAVGNHPIRNIQHNQGLEESNRLGQVWPMRPRHPRVINVFWWAKLQAFLSNRILHWYVWVKDFVTSVWNFKTLIAASNGCSMYGQLLSQIIPYVLSKAKICQEGWHICEMSAKMYLKTKCNLQGPNQKCNTVCQSNSQSDLTVYHSRPENHTILYDLPSPRLHSWYSKLITVL
jgi:hypothetical protein